MTKKWPKLDRRWYCNYPIEGILQMWASVRSAGWPELGIASFALVLLFGIAFDSPASATGPLFYATADYVDPGPGVGGTAVAGDQFIGARFQVSQPITIDAIGGNFQGTAVARTVWGAVVALTSFSDYPDSIEMTTPDVLAHATFSVPSPPPFESIDRIIPIGPLTVSPGVYAVIFGGGSDIVGEGIGEGPFGSDGQAILTRAAPIGTPSLFAGLGFASPFWRDNTSVPDTERLTVYGTVPEPSALVILPLGILLGLRKRGRLILTSNQGA